MTSEPRFSDIHLKKFKECEPKTPERDKANGKKVYAFAKALRGVELDRLSQDSISHDEVLEYVHSDRNTVTVCAAILAWGGMRYDNRDSLIKGGNYVWVDVCDEIRKGRISRKAAFASLRELRVKDKKLNGLGCAFFTKLIYFLQFHEGAQKPGGYIMDQWASETVNLMTDNHDSDPIVKLDTSWTTKWSSRSGKRKLGSSSLVSDSNTADNYENFCKAMDKLAVDAASDAKTPISRDTLDLWVMGDGTNSKESWRKYLVAKREERCPLSSDYG